MLIFQLVSKALTHSKSFSLTFILNFSLAIVALSYLQFFQGSINNSLESQAKNLLGADLVVSSRFPITKEQKEDLLQKLPTIKSMNEGISTVSMIAFEKRARLMEVVKINENFPFYGGITFDDNTHYPKKTTLPKADEIWVYQEVLDLLDIHKGEKLKIGKEYFTITKVIKEDSLKAVSFSGFMPKIYISQKGLKNTELLQFGSTARYKLNYLLEKKFSNDALEKIENSVENSIDKNLKILSPNDGRDRLLRVLNFVTNFLSLVSLVSFFLGLVGLIYLYSGFLNKHQKDITILNDLGVSKRYITLTYLLHLFSLILISTFIVFFFIATSSQFIAPIIQKLIGFHFDFSLNYSFFAQSSLLLLVLSISVGLPLIRPMLSKEKPHFFKTLLGFIPFILILLLISHFVTPFKNIGFFFALAVLCVIILFFTLGSFILKKLDFSEYLKNLSLSLALKNITRDKKTSLTLFTALVLCTTFFSLIPQVGASLSNLLTQNMENRPRFFIIDAQEEQIEAIQSQVKTMGATVENISPMIRGRIVKINGVDFTQSSQQKRRAINLSYRTQLKKSESIVKGVPFSGVYDSPDFSKPIEVSIEKRYAKKIGIDVGDSLMFDVLGMKLAGIVVNTRSVKWTEFVPNFFIIVQDGALNDAPKTLLATISSGEYNATAMILKLSDLFPSLSVIDVKNLFESFASLVKNVTNITDTMSIYSLIIGLLMSFIIIQYQMNLQKNNIF